MKNHSVQSPSIKTVFGVRMRGVSLVFLLAAVWLLDACVYKLDIQQGNILERDKVAQIKTGMTKRQVRYILGTPLVIDTFNQDRWDYFYSLKDYSPENRDGTFHQERLTLFFEKGQLSKIDNELLPDPVQPAAAPDKEKVVEPEPAENPSGAAP